MTKNKKHKKIKTKNAIANLVRSKSRSREEVQMEPWS